MKVIGVVGTRSRDSQQDFLLVEETFLNLYEEGDIICSGLCPQGGDRFAVLLRNKYKLEYIWYPANWKVYHKSAGFVRNPYIAMTSDHLIACMQFQRRGGTDNTVDHFIRFHGRENLYLL